MNSRYIEILNSIYSRYETVFIKSSERDINCLAIIENIDDDESGLVRFLITEYR
jgi:hypothetical protein